MAGVQSKAAAGITLILLAVFAVSIFAGAAAAGTFTVQVSEDELTPGETLFIPVYLTNADDVAGFQFYIKEDSSASMFIHDGSACVDGLFLNSAADKAVLYPEGHEPLSGTVKLFTIDLTPAEGENAQITFDIVEVVDSRNNDITSLYTGTPVILPVTGGSTVTSLPSEGDGVEWISQESEPSDVSDAAAQPVSTVTPAPKSSSKSKSPGFLPVTLIAALAAAGILIVRSRRRGQ
ncbi:MAG TPA: hypothetical protein O0X97_03160 [Methanocorpusculum sp.]|nr:hypothetical protein [Methanocorpusculum sp.]